MTIEDGVVISGAIICAGAVVKSGSIVHRGSMIASGVILAENIVLPKYSHVISRDVSTKESTSNNHTIVDPNAGTLHEGKARFYFGRFPSCPSAMHLLLT